VTPVTTVALYHSVLGVRPGLLAAADRLRAAGHEVHVVDQYDGRVFDDYQPALEFMESLGFPALMGRALEAAGGLADGLVTMGFSNGAGMAEYVAGSRPGVAGVVMIGGALDPGMLGIDWPAGVAGQVHTTVDDPWRDDGIDAVRAAAQRAGAEVEAFDYPGSGHLFADPSMPAEYQPADAALLWSRVDDFLGRVDGRT
jgi:dienelactone hydrolase